MLRSHHLSIPITVGTGIADVTSMIVEVGDDLKEEFNWKLENFTIRVRSRSRERDKSSIYTQLLV